MAQCESVQTIIEILLSSERGKLYLYRQSRMGEMKV